MRRWREEHTLVKRQSWCPSKDGGLRMVNWESQSKTPSQSPEDGHIYCILLIRIAFSHVSKTCHFAACFTILWTSISVFYVNTARDVVTGLLTFARYSSLYLHIFTCTYRCTHTQAHMYVQSAHKRNGDNQAQEPG